MFQTLLTILLWFAFATGTSAVARPQTIVLDVPSDTVITLVRLDCVFGCPVYTLTIYADGKVLYEGKKEVKTIGKAEGRISQEKLKGLIIAFKKLDYFALRASYTMGEEVCLQYFHDFSSAGTSLVMSGRKKSVSHYLGCKGLNVTGELTSLEASIDKAVNVDQWIK